MIAWLRRLLCAHAWCTVQGTLTLKCLKCGALGHAECAHDWLLVEGTRNIKCVRCGKLVEATCVHDWKLVDKTVLPSAVEQVANMRLEYTDSPNAMFRKTLTITVKCDKCGELRVERTVNP